MVKNLPANAGDIRNTGLTPGSGRSPGGGHGNPTPVFLPAEFQRRNAPICDLMVFIALKPRATCVCLCMLSSVQLFATLWTSPPGSSLQGFPRQEYWSGLPFPPPGDLPDPGIEPASLVSPALAGSFCRTKQTNICFLLTVTVQVPWRRHINTT